MKLSRKSNITIVFIIIFIVSIFFGIIIRSSNTAYFKATEAYVDKIAAEAIKDSVDNYLKDNKISYSDLFFIDKDKDGKVTSMVCDSVKISELQLSLADDIEKYLSEYPVNYIEIPLGSAQNIETLSSVGPMIKYKVKPTSVSSVNIRDELDTGGINQVKHSIYLDISIVMSVSTRFKSYDFKVNNSIMITNAVIVGDVPSFYEDLRSTK